MPTINECDRCGAQAKTSSEEGKKYELEKYKDQHYILCGACSQEYYEVKQQATVLESTLFEQYWNKTKK